MVKRFNTPFAINGDKEEIPENAQIDGSVSYAQGNPVGYELPYDDNRAKNIERKKTNQLFYDITNALREIQQNGISVWCEDGKPYKKGSLAFLDGVIKQSLIEANNNEFDHLTWADVGIDGLIKKVDKTITINNKALDNNIILNKEDIGLENVDNTSDNEKVVKSSTKWEIPRNFTIGNTTKLVDGSSDVVFNLEEITGDITNTANKSASGWFKDSSTGIIFQWGYANSNGQAWSEQYFPIAFPNGVLTIVYGSHTGNAVPRGQAWRKTGFGYCPANSRHSATHYLAIGW